METIKIDGVEYSIKNTIDDINVREWFEITKIYSEKYMVDKGELGDGSRLTEEAEPTPEFLLNKRINVFKLISDIPHEYLIEEVIDQLEPLVEGYYDLKAHKVVTYDKSRFTIRPLSKWTFQQFCDYESFDESIHAFLHSIIPTSDVNKKYDRYTYYYQENSGVLNLPAKIFIPLYMYLLDEVKKFKGYFKYLFELDLPGYPSGKNMREHYKRFKWEDTIATLAETPVFNSPKGTLHGVRTARAAEVLEYLNLKRSKNSAEYVDSKFKK